MTDFNEEWYVARYPDVAKAIQEGKLSSGFEHYLKHGQKAGRLPLPPKVADKESQVQRVILHVGPHKTGSSYIQNALAAHYDSFLSLGYDYVPFWRSANVCGHFSLYQEIRNQNFRTVEDGFHKILSSNSPNIIISAEDLSILSEQELFFIKSCLANKTVEIIFYIRRWSDLIPSLWQESIKQGFSLSLPEKCFTYFSNPFASCELNFSHKIERFISIFGRDSIKIVLYSTLMDSGSDIFEHFTKVVLGINVELPITSKSVNASMPATDIELIRLLNIVNSSYSKHKQPIIKRLNNPRKDPRLQSIRQNLIQELREEIVKHQRSLIIDDEIPAFRELYDIINKRYSDLLPSGHRAIFEPRKREVKYIGDTLCIQPGIIGNIYDLYHIL